MYGREKALFRSRCRRVKVSAMAGHQPTHMVWLAYVGLQGTLSDVQKRGRNRLGALAATGNVLHAMGASGGGAVEQWSLKGDPEMVEKSGKIGIRGP